MGIITTGLILTPVIIISYYQLPRYEYRLAYVDSVMVKDFPQKGLETTIHINGTLPSSCSTLFYHFSSIDDLSKEVNIFLWESVALHGGCLPMVIDYNYEVLIIFPSSGYWIVSCNYKNITVLVY